MALANPPSAWVHAWLTPLWNWIVNSLVPAVNGQGDLTVQTPGAVATTIGTVAVPTGKTLLVTMAGGGTKADASAASSFIYRAAFRNNAGVVTAVGNDEVDFDVKDDNTWGDPSSVISGTNVLLKVTGKAATTINWAVKISTSAA